MDPCAGIKWSMATKDLLDRRCVFMKIAVVTLCVVLLDIGCNGEIVGTVVANREVHFRERTLMTGFELVV